MNTIKVDFGKKLGEIKPLNAMCCAPYTCSLHDNQIYIDKYFKEGNVPYCRLHDCCGEYGGAHYVDIPNIFPDFDADENDPKNYDFHYTDEYIAAIQKTGCEAYYRLGVTIEHGTKKYGTIPPTDFNKWARICEHVIMHYNYGWADGFNYNLKYWEIWNEPENPYNKCMWSGSDEEFFELYEISSKYLKNKFPEIKVGGYASCGFYAITRENPTKEEKLFVDYFIKFVEMAKERNCPFDFFSWHIYSDDVEEVVAHGKYAREVLDKYGFGDTEIHLNEWNHGAEGKSFDTKHNCEGMSFNAAVMCALANTDYVDMAMYYCFSITAMYNGLLDNNTRNTEVTWYPFVAYGRLLQMKNRAYCTCDGDGFYACAACAACDDDKFGILAVNYENDDAEFKFDISNLKRGKNLSIKYINDRYKLEEVISYNSKENDEIKIKLNKQTVVFITVE